LLQYHRGGKRAIGPQVRVPFAFRQRPLRKRGEANIGLPVPGKTRG